MGICILNQFPNHHSIESLLVSKTNQNNNQKRRIKYYYTVAVPVEKDAAEEKKIFEYVI